MLFKAPMVRALLAGTKTQTRRVIKPAPFVDKMGNFCVPDRRGRVGNWGQRLDGRPCTRNFAEAHIRIRAGDRLWVREAWQTGSSSDGPQIAFRATPDFFEIDAWDGPDEGIGPSFNYDRCPSAHFHHWLPDVLNNDGPWRPSIHMPRWTSRLTLIVTDVRVQRLQDISEEDARAEGAYVAPRSGRVADDYVTMAIAGSWFASGRGWYANLWDRINGTGSWAANPWVAAYTFTVHQKNIDALQIEERKAGGEGVAHGS
jgi:hypothetical protein